MKACFAMFLAATLALLAGCSQDQEATMTERDRTPSDANRQTGAYPTDANQPSGAYPTDNQTTGLTPLDQGETQADITITQQVRREIMADSSLSLSAKNVKIIASQGKVTLRGTVANEREKSGIEEIARKAPGVTTVDNQLEVENRAP